MTDELHAGITRFCRHWQHAPTLQQTFSSLCDEISAENDGCIDAAKSLVECACQVMVSELDDPKNPIKQWPNSPIRSDYPSITNWVTAAIRLLQLSEKRDDPFNKVISQHHKLAEELGNFRNAAGTLSHGKNGFSKKLSAHHRKAAILSADAIITFLHEAYLERELDPVGSNEPFERFGELSKAIDNHCSFKESSIDEDGLRVKVTFPNGDDVDMFFNPSDLLFNFDRIAYKAAYESCDGLPVDSEETE